MKFDSAPKFESKENKSIPVFPVEHIDKIFYKDQSPELTEDRIVHYIEQAVLSPSGIHKFKLQTTVEGVSYILACIGDTWGSGHFTLVMKTKDHGYARASLSQEGVEELFKRRAGFVNSLVDNGYAEVEHIVSEPYSGSYTVNEVEDCASKILENGTLDYSHEELIQGFTSIELFRLYEELFGEPYRDESELFHGKNKARGRLFRMMFNKYLPDTWEVKQDPNGGDVHLILKKEG